MHRNFSFLLFFFVVPLIYAQNAPSSQGLNEQIEQALTLEVEAGQASQDGDIDAAVDKCRRAALRLRELGVGEQDQAVCWLLVGSLESGRGKHKEAIEALRASLQLLDRLHPPKDLLAKNHYYLAQSLLGAGLMEVKLGHFSQAENFLEEALALQRRTRASSSDLGETLQKLAEVYQLQGNFDDALPLVQEAIQLGQEAAAFKTLGSIYAGKGDYVRALESFERAEVIHLGEGDQIGVWVVRTSKAKIYYSQGRIEEALVLYEGAVQAFRSLGDVEQLPAALVGTGAIYRLQGRLEDARKAHQEALELRRRSGNKSGEAIALNNLAAVELALGLWEQSLARLEESLEIRREVGDRQGEATTLGNSGHLLFELGRLEEAVVRFKKSLEISREVGNPKLVAMNLQKLAQISYLHRPEEALVLIEQALELARKMGDRSAELAALKIKGVILAGRGDQLQALEVLSNARTLSHEAGDRSTEAEVRALEGLVHFRLGHKEEATRILRDALTYMEEVGQVSLRGSVFLALGIIEQSSGRTKEAIQAYRDAVQAEEQISIQIRTDELLQGLRGGTDRTYGQLLRLLALSDDPKGAFGVAEQARSQTFLRQMGNRRVGDRNVADQSLAEEERRLEDRLRDLNRQVVEEKRKNLDQQALGVLNYLAQETDQVRRQYENVLIRLKQANLEYALLIRPSSLGLNEVQQQLDPGLTLIEYFSLKEQLLAWVIDRNSYHLFLLPIPADTLAEQVTLLRHRIASREEDGGVSAALYKNLFAPLVPSVHHENLVIVPHGALHSLPFAALLDGSGRPLIERYKVRLLPSASVLPFLREKRSSNEGRLLVLGNPDGSLPHAGKEARAVGALYGTEPLLGTQATESALRKRAQGADVVHLAAHAMVEPARPLFSRIDLSPDGIEDGRLELHEVFNLDLAGTNLVVLSGCGTALGNLTGGDDLTGFTRAFLYAGAPSVLATLWPVDDEASSALMASFHRHLRQGAAPAKALQAAQSEIESKEKWRSPYYWAGYILTGDGG